jgi:hypothetical protein
VKYTYSQLSIEFEIPDEWLHEAGVYNYKPTSEAYEPLSNGERPTEIMSFNNLQAPIRDPGTTWFNKKRMVSLMKGVISGKAMPPVEVHLKPEENKYSVKNGFHRFYMSVALGFKALPVTVRPYFDFNEL